MTVVELGCCGAYCRTCKVFAAKACKGCKIGYENGERDITKAKCSIKRCCMEKQLFSCADCPEYDECPTIQEFHNHQGYKYGKYKQAIEYIRANGYEKFFQLADAWGNAYGIYE